MLKETSVTDHTCNLTSSPSEYYKRKEKNMGKKRLSVLQNGFLRKSFYDEVVGNSCFAYKATTGEKITNGYMAEFVEHDNMSPRFMKVSTFHNNFQRKVQKFSKDPWGSPHVNDFLEDIPEEQAELSSMLGNCPDHPNEGMKYFCESCDELICLDCTASEHRKHKFFYLKDVYHKKKHHMGSLLEQGKAQIENTRKLLNEVKNTITKIQEGKRKLENAIKEKTWLLIQTLQEREKELLTEINTAYKSKNDFLRKEKERLEFSLGALSGCCQFTEKAIKFGNELEILVIQKHLKRRLKELSKSMVETRLSCSGRANYFVEENAVKSAKELLGHIVVSNTCPELSTACGEGLERGHIGVPAKILVQAKMFNNMPCVHGGEKISVTVRRPVSESLPVEVEDLNDGTYTAAFVPKTSGKHKIEITIQEQSIKGSPFTVPVSSPRTYSENTQLKFSFGGLGQLSGKFKFPCGVTVDRNDRIIAADCRNHRIQIFDSQGKLIKCFGVLGEKNGQFNSPTDVAVDFDDNILVCDRDNHRIQRFTKDGIFLNKFGGQGGGDGKFKRPWGVTVSKENEIIVVDRRNNRIQIFAHDGNFLRKFGCHGNGPEDLDNPYHAAVSPNGNVYVTDANNHRIQVFSSKGAHITQFGNDGEMGAQLQFPTGITFDAEGHVIVCDQYNHRLQVYRKDHCLVATLKSGLNGLEQPCFPKGIAVSQGGHIVVADGDNDRIIVL
mgnify:CR=1 FL=1